MKRAALGAKMGAKMAKVFSNPAFMAFEVASMVLDTVDPLGLGTFESNLDNRVERNALEYAWEQEERELIRENAEDVGVEEVYPQLFPLAELFHEEWPKAEDDTWEELFQEAEDVVNGESVSFEDDDAYSMQVVAVAKELWRNAPKRDEALLRNMQKYLHERQKKDDERRANGDDVSAEVVGPDHVALYPQLSQPGRIGVSLSAIGMNYYRDLYREHWKNALDRNAQGVIVENRMPPLLVYTDVYREANPEFWKRSDGSSWKDRPFRDYPPMLAFKLPVRVPLMSPLVDIYRRCHKVRKGETPGFDDTTGLCVFGGNYCQTFSMNHRPSARTEDVDYNEENRYGKVDLHTTTSRNGDPLFREDFDDCDIDVVQGAAGAVLGTTVAAGLRAYLKYHPINLIATELFDADKSCDADKKGCMPIGFGLIWERRDAAGKRDISGESALTQALQRRYCAGYVEFTQAEWSDLNVATELVAGDYVAVVPRCDGRVDYCPEIYTDEGQMQAPAAPARYSAPNGKQYVRRINRRYAMNQDSEKGLMKVLGPYDGPGDQRYVQTDVNGIQEDARFQTSEKCGEALAAHSVSEDYVYAIYSENDRRCWISKKEGLLPRCDPQVTRPYEPSETHFYFPDGAHSPFAEPAAPAAAPDGVDPPSVLYYHAVAPVSGLLWRRAGRTQPRTGVELTGVVKDIQLLKRLLQTRGDRPELSLEEWKECGAPAVHPATIVKAAGHWYQPRAHKVCIADACRTGMHGGREQGDRCNRHYDCLPPPGVSQGVCRAGVCQSGREDALCGVAEDCVPGFPCVDGRCRDPDNFLEAAEGYTARARREVAGDSLNLGNAPHGSCASRCNTTGTCIGYSAPTKTVHRTGMESFDVPSEGECTLYQREINDDSQNRMIKRGEGIVTLRVSDGRAFYAKRCVHVQMEGEEEVSDNPPNPMCLEHNDREGVLRYNINDATAVEKLDPHLAVETTNNILDTGLMGGRSINHSDRQAVAQAQQPQLDEDAVVTDAAGNTFIGAEVNAWGHEHDHH